MKKFARVKNGQVQSCQTTFFQALTEKHRQAVELMAQLRKTKEQIEGKSGKVKPDVLYSLLQVNFISVTGFINTLANF